MNGNPIEARDPREYDIDYEMAASRNMLEKRVPAELNKIKLAIVDIDKARSWEPWRLALTVDLVDAIERNCEQLLETMNNDRIGAWRLSRSGILLPTIAEGGVSRNCAALQGSQLTGRQFYRVTESEMMSDCG